MYLADAKLSIAEMTYAMKIPIWKGVLSMRVLSRLFHSRDKPSDYYSGTDYRFLFGPTTSGKSVNEFTAMQTTAVYSCVRILSEAIASLPQPLFPM